MIRKSLIAAASIALLVGSTAGAAPCRDPKTHRFIKCATASAAPVANVVKYKSGRCHVASGPNKGKFTKCP